MSIYMSTGRFHLLITLVTYLMHICCYCTLMSLLVYKIGMQD